MNDNRYFTLFGFLIDDIIALHSFISSFLLGLFAKKYRKRQKQIFTN